jgi:hypothetical protein
VSPAVLAATLAALFGTGALAAPWDASHDPGDARSTATAASSVPLPPPAAIFAPAPAAPIAASTAAISAIAAASDANAPTVVIMNPAGGASVSGYVTVSANAAGGAGAAAVQFMLDGTELGVPESSAPFTMTWNSSLFSDGAHALGAVARGTDGAAATAVVAVTVLNTPPVISPPSATVASADRVDLLWTTNQRSDSAADYGPTTGYGRTTPVDPAQTTSHALALKGLAPGTLYHCRVRSTNAAGVLSVSDDFTVTTLGASPIAAAAAPAAAPTAKAPQKFLAPASGGANQKAVFGPDAREVSIYDVRGKLIFRASSPGPGAPVVWTGRDNSGHVVPSGVYVAKIRTLESTLVYQSFAVAK